MAVEVVVGGFVDVFVVDDNDNDDVDSVVVLESSKSATNTACKNVFELC